MLFTTFVKAKYIYSDSSISLFWFLSQHTDQHPSRPHWQSCWPCWGLSLPMFLDWFMHVWLCKCHINGSQHVLFPLPQHLLQHPPPEYLWFIILMCRMSPNIFEILGICLNEKCWALKVQLRFFGPEFEFELERCQKWTGPCSDFESDFEMPPKACHRNVLYSYYYYLISSLISKICRLISKIL